MTSEDLEDKYPHWKDALFGNHNAVANLRCAVHYVFWHGVYALLAVIGVLVVGGAIYLLVTAFWQFLAAVGGGLGVVILLVGLALLWEKLRDPAKSAANGAAAKANVAGQKAVQTPGVRRVYGECPVSLDQAPHWFENLFPEDEV